MTAPALLALAHGSRDRRSAATVHALRDEVRAAHVQVGYGIEVVRRGCRRGRAGPGGNAQPSRLREAEAVLGLDGLRAAPPQ